MFVVLSTIIKGVVFFHGWLFISFMMQLRDVTFFDMELEQLLVNDQSTASCQTINRVKPRD